MSAALQYDLVTEQDYLAGELVAAVKHEYLGGAVHAMAGGSLRHNRISGNIFAALHLHLKGKRCQPFNSDTKVRIRLPSHVRYYYPDAMVVCQSNPPLDTFQDEPVIVIEVLSRATRRLDEGEKLEAYQSIPTLDYLLLVEQESARVVFHKRTAFGFQKQVAAGLDDDIQLEILGMKLSLSDVYDGVDFSAEPDPSPT